MATITDIPASDGSRQDLPGSKSEVSGRKLAKESGDKATTSMPSESQALIAYLRSYMERRNESLKDLEPETSKILEAADTLVHWIRSSRLSAQKEEVATTRMSAFLDVLQNTLRWADSSGQRVEVFKNWMSETVETLQKHSNATKDASSRKADKLSYDLSEDVGRIEYEGKLILQMFDERSQPSSEAKADNLSVKDVKGSRP
ncbi:hypothetical protein CERSUDRAFT_116080 [Gelatoporia subvermispora B]|uniref:Uncharacterized protein n=1 Tax=Ceriporiopsis subvermispora (strain B) TaxID=914234 RepID=M2QDZ3_CERS8|nr:hypothetical protein CERSUDRAFT_116080 [Gelatoporia subvermispora B]